MKYRLCATAIMIVAGCSSDDTGTACPTPSSADAGGGTNPQPADAGGGSDAAPTDADAPAATADVSTGPNESWGYPYSYLGTESGKGTKVDTSHVRVHQPGAANYQDGEAFIIPFTPSNPFAPAADPLDVSAAPKAYVFDAKCAPQTGSGSPFPLGEQGTVFTQTPAYRGYSPVVQEVPVTSNGERCQDIKSEATLLRDAPSLVTVGAPSGKYLVRPIFDAKAPIATSDYDADFPDNRMGWFDRSYVSYLEGGHVPTKQVSGPSGTKTVMVPQTLLVPTMVPGKDAQGKDIGVPGKPGAGWDIMQAIPPDPAYSPVCKVQWYSPDDPLMPKDDPTKLSESENLSKTSVPETYVYCLFSCRVSNARQNIFGCNVNTNK